jgi:hypothetical protein
MANREIIAGVETYALYAEESTYGTSPGTIDQPFGLIQDFKVKENAGHITSYGFVGSSSGGRKPASIIAGKFEGTVTIDLQPQDMGFLKYVLGAVSGAGTVASPFAYTVGSTVPSVTVSSNHNNVTTDRENQYLGVVFATMTLRCSVGEALTCTLEGMYGDVTKDSTISSNQALSTNSPFTFVGGSIEIPNASAISNIIDSVELTVSNNSEVFYGIGSRTSKQGIAKKLALSMKFTVKELDETIIDTFRGSSSAVGSTQTADATVALRFDDGSNHYVDIILTNGKIADWGNNESLHELVTEDLTYSAEDITINVVTQA